MKHIFILMAIVGIHSKTYCQNAYYDVPQLTINGKTYKVEKYLDNVSRYFNEPETAHSYTVYNINNNMKNRGLTRNVNPDCRNPFMVNFRELQVQAKAINASVLSPERRAAIKANEHVGVTVYIDYLNNIEISFMLPVNTLLTPTELEALERAYKEQLRPIFNASNNKWCVGNQYTWVGFRIE